MNKEGLGIELLELYYKKYTDTVEALDYIEWAKQHLYMSVPEINKLANWKDSLNLMEMEAIFAEAMKTLQRKAPSKKDCMVNHLRSLHSQLLMPTHHAIPIAKEIYDCAKKNDLLGQQNNWREINHVIDDFQYRNNPKGLTEDKIRGMISILARRLWHTKISDITFETFIGQKVTVIDSEIHLIIQLEKGALIIECPWRIRNTSGLLLGETDVLSNPSEWKSIEELLIGKTIEDIQLLEQCPLLIIQFDNLFLDVFHASTFFDGWTLTDEGDFYLFSMHGGEIA